eukprot:695128_1
METETANQSEIELPDAPIEQEPRTTDAEPDATEPDATEPPPPAQPKPQKPPPPDEGPQPEEKEAPQPDEGPQDATQTQPQETPQPYEGPQTQPQETPQPYEGPQTQPQETPQSYEGPQTQQERTPLTLQHEDTPSDGGTSQSPALQQERTSMIIHPTQRTMKRPIPLASVSIPICDETKQQEKPTLVALATPDPNQPETPASPMHRRKNTLEIEGSLFRENEARWSVIWLVYTFAYWTLLTWMPIIVRRSFVANIWGLAVYVPGAIGMMSTAYTIYIGQYPSGSTREDSCAIDGIGRYPAAVMTTTVIIDCCVLVYVTVDLEHIDGADTLIYNTQLTRLVLHIVHIFWASLFFYNRFYYNHRSMAIRAFVFEWGDIIWSTIVSFMITEAVVGPFVDKIYFVIVGVALIGWLTPMMFIKRWGTRKNARKVAIHLLCLDLLTDGPVIVALLATQAYKNNVILWIDLFWKSGLLARSVSSFAVKYYLRNIAKDASIVESSTIYGVSLEFITFMWVIAVGIYWNAVVLTRCIYDHEIARNYEYYTWFVGMIGLFFILDACMAGHSAEKRYGKPFMAFTCLVISVDSILHAYELLAGFDTKEDFVGEATMICHCIALAFSILFYSHDFTRGIRYSFVLQWIDIILMFIVIELLNRNLTGDGNCFSEALCIGYFVVFSIKIIFWFAPIMLGYAKDDKTIHKHMVLLDTFTDLPLVLTIIFTDGYKIHEIVFFDIFFKIIMLLIAYAYHLLISLVLAKCQRDLRARNNNASQA